MDWRRHVLGGIGVLFLAVGVFRLVATGDFGETWTSLGMRVGIILVAIWLALPQIQQLLARVPLWLLVTLAIAFFFVLRNARLLPIALLFVGVIVALKVAGRMLGIFNSPGSPQNLPRRGRVIDAQHRGPHEADRRIPATNSGTGESTGGGTGARSSD